MFKPFFGARATCYQAINNNWDVGFSIEKLTGPSSMHLDLTNRTVSNDVPAMDTTWEAELRTTSVSSTQANIVFRFTPTEDSQP